METPVFVGVDGCRAGWLSISLSSAEAWDVHLFETVDALVESYDDATILIDIPIGLPCREKPVRACDQQLRRLLGARRSSVFSPPCRESLECASYDEATQMNRHMIGLGLSKQSWNIAPKIAQVDKFIRRFPALQRRLRESHPEACFRTLAKGRLMTHPKRTREGFYERLAVLQNFFAPAAALIQSVMTCFPRKMCARDDIVDALCLAVTARARKGRFQTIPRKAEYDSEAIGMSISF